MARSFTLAVAFSTVFLSMAAMSFGQVRPLVIYVKHDDPVVEQTLLEFLTDLGNTAVAIESNDNLSERLKASDPKPDVFITELGNRDEDVELLQQTHRQHPKMAVLLITNGGRSLSASEAESCGIHYFLREPIRLSEIELYLTRIAGIK